MRVRFLHPFRIRRSAEPMGCDIHPFRGPTPLQAVQTTAHVYSIADTIRFALGSSGV